MREIITMLIVKPFRLRDLVGTLDGSGFLNLMHHCIVKSCHGARFSPIISCYRVGLRNLSRLYFFSTGVDLLVWVDIMKRSR